VAWRGIFLRRILESRGEAPAPVVVHGIRTAFESKVRAEGPAMRSRDLGLGSTAARLEALIRQRGDYAHVEVQARAGHLLIKTQDGQGVQSVIARATPMGGGQYGLSFR